MAMSLKTDIKNIEEPMDHWDQCPPEILLMVFELLPPQTLVSCMYVNSKWRSVAGHIAKIQNKWQDIFDELIPCRGDEFKLKSLLPLDYIQLFNNYELWNNLNMAVIMLEKIHNDDGVLKLNVYRGRDFYENDDMILVARDHTDRCTKLYLYKKETVDEFNMDASNVIEVEKVMLYKVENKRCYVVDRHSSLFAYAIFYPDWTEIFIARYYGNPFESCFINAYNDQMFLMLKCGKVLYVNPFTRSVTKILELEPPLAERSSTIFAKMFHKCGFVYGVAASETFSFERFTTGRNNVYVYRCPRISCVLQHGEIIAMGYLDGEVEFHMPRSFSKSSLLRRFNVRDYEPTADLEILSIEVFEGKGLHHLFVATVSQVLRFKILYTNEDEYIFKHIPRFATIVPEPSAKHYDF